MLNFSPKIRIGNRIKLRW